MAPPSAQTRNRAALHKKPKEPLNNDRSDQFKKKGRKEGRNTAAPEERGEAGEALIEDDDGAGGAVGGAAVAVAVVGVGREEEGGGVLHHFHGFVVLRSPAGPGTGWNLPTSFF